MITISDRSKILKCDNVPNYISKEPESASFDAKKILWGVGLEALNSAINRIYDYKFDPFSLESNSNKDSLVLLEA